MHEIHFNECVPFTQNALYPADFACVHDLVALERGRMSKLPPAVIFWLFLIHQGNTGTNQKKQRNSIFQCCVLY